MMPFAWLCTLSEEKEDYKQIPAFGVDTDTETGI